MQIGDCTLGRILAARRVLIGLRQNEVAERAGTSAEYISQIERGRRLPSSALLRRIVDALKMPRQAA